MKLGCNYSREAWELLEEGRIDVDYFKYPAVDFHMGALEKGREAEFLALAREVTRRRPILIHGLYPECDLASPAFMREFDPEAMERLVAATGAPGVSFHPAKGHPGSGIDRHTLMKTIIGNIRYVKSLFGYLDFVAVENGELPESDTMTEIVRESGCDFLLDISHAYCAARRAGEEVLHFITRFPLDRVSEIHMNGWIDGDGEPMCHVKIHEEGYALLREVLSLCRPGILTLEYGRTVDRLGAGIPLVTSEGTNPAVKEEIAEQIARLRELAAAS